MLAHHTLHLKLSFRDLCAKALPSVLGLGSLGERSTGRYHAGGDHRAVVTQEAHLVRECLVTDDAPQGLLANAGVHVPLVLFEGFLAPEGLLARNTAVRLRCTGLLGVWLPRRGNGAAEVVHDGIHVHPLVKHQVAALGKG